MLQHISVLFVPECHSRNYFDTMVSFNIGIRSWLTCSDHKGNLESYQRGYFVTYHSPFSVLFFVCRGVREGPLRHVRNGVIAPFPETLNSPHIVTDGRYRGLVRLTFRPVCDVRAENIPPYNSISKCSHACTYSHCLYPSVINWKIMGSLQSRMVQKSLHKSKCDHQDGPSHSGTPVIMRSMNNIPGVSPTACNWSKVADWVMYKSHIRRSIVRVRIIITS